MKSKPREAAMQVADAMSHQPVMIDAFDTVEDAAALMRMRVVGALPVIERGRLAGIVTDRDLVLRSTAHGDRPGEIHVRQVMTEQPVTCRPEEPLELAVERMIARRVRRLIVVDELGVAGMLTLEDLAASPSSESAELALQLLGQLARVRGLELDGSFADQKI
jgi:CBS domain-containing protein